MTTEMGVDDAIKLCKHIDSITALPLRNPTALYLWLSDSPNMSSYIKADIEFRQMAKKAKAHMTRERAMPLAKEIIELADARLLAAAMPVVSAHRERLLGGRADADQPVSKKWMDVLARMSQALLSLLAFLRSG